MSNCYDRARFLAVFVSYVRPGDWITASALTQLIVPGASSELSQEFARKLSNLNRFGHLDRRQRPDGTHEYTRRPNVPVVLPAEFASAFRFGPIPLQENRQEPIDL